MYDLTTFEVCLSLEITKEEGNLDATKKIEFSSEN